jgi:Uma2 family endonuclease
MIQALPELVTFDEFIEWKPSDALYELRNGVIVEMRPRGNHEEVTGFLVDEFMFQARTQQLPFFAPKQALVKSPTDENTAYLPDVLLVDRRELVSEPYWEKASTLTRGSSMPLIVEVVSTSWRDDYLKKLADYEAIGVKEYWLADYLGLGRRRFIGDLKQPTLSICALVDGEYELRKFRGSDRIISPTFPDLTLTVDQIFAAGQ